MEPVTCTGRCWLVLVALMSGLAISVFSVTPGGRPDSDATPFAINVVVVTRPAARFHLVTVKLKIMGSNPISRN